MLYNYTSPRHGVDADTSNWDWLGLNESVDTTTTRENRWARTSTFIPRSLFL